MATTQATVGVIKDASITAAKMAANSVDSASYVDGSIDPEHLADNAVTLAKMASGTDGNIISYDASGNPVAIATGTDGQVLTSAGAGAQPAFEDAGGGGAWNLISSTEASNDATLLITGLSSTYKVFAVSIDALDPVSTSQLRMQVGSSSGLITAEVYGSHTSTLSHTSDAYSGQKSGNVGFFELSEDDGVASVQNYNALFYLHRNLVSGVNGDPMFHGSHAAHSGATGNLSSGSIAGYMPTVTAFNLDRIQFAMSTGNINTGTFTVWGIANA